MSLRTAMRLACASAITLGMFDAAEAYVLAEVGEWVVSCDNTGTCAAVNASQRTQLRVARPSIFGMSRLCIHRRGSPADAPELHITMIGEVPSNRSNGAVERTLRIVSPGGGPRDFPLRWTGSSNWIVPAADSADVLEALGDEVQLQIVSGEGALHGRLAVDGIGQALAMIDGAQRRSGTNMAPGQIGGQDQKSLPALVTAPLPRLRPGVVPSEQASMLSRKACMSQLPEATVGSRLPGDSEQSDRILWVSRCGAASGLKQGFHAIEEADGQAAPVHFSGAPPERPTGRPGVLANPGLDAEKGLVRERWIATIPVAGGTCAIQRLWGWNGRDFELAEERRSLSCAGIVSGYWPRTYTRPLITPATNGAPAEAAGAPPACR